MTQICEDCGQPLQLANNDDPDSWVCYNCDYDPGDWLPIYGDPSNTFNVIFDNGGGITLQTDTYCHHYDYGADAARDTATLLSGADTGDWDGNDPDGRMEYDYNVEYNGGYKWHNQYNVNRILSAGGLDHYWGRNMEDFYTTLLIIVSQATPQKKTNPQ